jgi:hypothetical protein
MGMNTSCKNNKEVLTHTSDSRLMRRDCRQGKEVFNVVVGIKGDVVATEC